MMTKDEFKFYYRIVREFFSFGTPVGNVSRKKLKIATKCFRTRYNTISTRTAAYRFNKLQQVEF